MKQYLVKFKSEGIKLAVPYEQVKYLQKDAHNFFKAHVYENLESYIIESKDLESVKLAFTEKEYEHYGYNLRQYYDVEIKFLKEKDYNPFEVLVEKGRIYYLDHKIINSDKILREIEIQCVNNENEYFHLDY